MTATKPKFIDAHHHLWEPTTLEYGWLRQIGEPKPFGDPTPIQRDYVKDEFWTEACAEGAFASVHVQADGGLPDPVAESDWIVEQTTREPGLGVPNAWVGFANLRHDDVEATLAAHAARPGFRGVRHIVARTDARSRPTVGSPASQASGPASALGPVLRRLSDSASGPVLRRPSG